MEDSGTETLLYQNIPQTQPSQQTSDEIFRSALAISTSIREKSAAMFMLPGFLPASLEDERDFMVRTFSHSTVEDGKTPVRNQDECLLCMEEFNESRQAASSLCNCGVNSNRFHRECLLKWKAKMGRTRCPICEEEIYFDEEDGHHHEEEEEGGGGPNASEAMVLQ